MSSNPLYDAWKSKGFVKEPGFGWREPMARSTRTEDLRREILKSGENFIHRDKLVRQYSWAVPSPEAIKWIAERTKSICEIGAGRGYWANLINDTGVKVEAYDMNIARGRMARNGWHNPRSPLSPDLLSPELETGDLFYPVQRGGAKKAAEHPDKTLFLCWPPHSSKMALDCLKHYRGKQILYCGEWNGCCADEKFFGALEKDWKEIGCFDIPQWPCIRDHLWLLKRKVKPAPLKKLIVEKDYKRKITLDE